MDARAEKLANARKKLRDHQVKKTVTVQNELSDKPSPIKHESKVQMAIDINIPEKQSHEENAEHKNELYSKNNSDNHFSGNKSEVNVTEMLISNNTNLEMQIKNLNEKLAQLEILHGSEISNHNASKHRIAALELELHDMSIRFSKISQDVDQKDNKLKDLQLLHQRIVEDNNNLTEQLEFTKSMLTAKESENAHLHSQVSVYHNQLDSAMLQIQQLTNNSMIQPVVNSSVDQSEELKRQISSLEQQIGALQKERDNINSHYEHYVKELSEQLKIEVIKNENNTQTIQNLYNRESSLIEQISDMEIRLQNYQKRIANEVVKTDNSNNNQELQTKYDDIQKQLEETKIKCNNLQEQYSKSLEKIQELTESKETKCDHDNISISKLNADIASDKLAAQRATEQNRKLKKDVEDLEQVIVKVNKDKLELTEKLTHEKQLNKDMALKLAEIDENAKNMSKLLKAKDNEMIRLQNNNREIEKKYENMLEDINHIKHATGDHSHDTIEENTTNNLNDAETNNLNDVETALIPGHTCAETNHAIAELDIKHDKKFIHKEDAMLKLQERFLNIMDEVANLSDEKHRLEHIILQLQNETETICEYVALYQQQRSLLKKREEERSNQLKIFQTECDLLKSHLEALRDLLLRLAADEELASYLKDEARTNDIARVKDLLEKLQNCSLINPKYYTLDLNIFYPCNCCSGQLINI